MELHYQWGDEYHDNDYDYEITFEELKRFIKDILSSSEIIEFIDNVIDDEEKEYYGLSSIEDITNLWISDKYSVYEIIENHGNEFYSDFEEELLEYFEEDAVEQCKDEEEYNRDPLGYYGMSWKDFI